MAPSIRRFFVCSLLSHCSVGAVGAAPVAGRLQFPKGCHHLCSLDGFVKAEVHVLGQTCEDRGDKAIVKIDAHMIIECGF